MNPETNRDPLAALDLTAAIRAQASRLLAVIGAVQDLSDLLRAADRAEGFALGIETVHALSPIDVENLYVVLEAAAQARRAELQG